MNSKKKKFIVIGVAVFVALAAFATVYLAVINPQILTGKATSQSGAWNIAKTFDTYKSFRAHMAVMQGKLYVLAKDPTQKDDNKGGEINMFIFDGSSWTTSRLPGCKSSGKEYIGIGSFSDPMVYGDRMYFGTYPRTSFNSFDGTTCRVLYSYPWGSSVWQTASRGVYYGNSIYFVAYKIVGGSGRNEGKESEKLIAFNPDSGDFPGMTAVATSYQKADGRDPREGPMAVMGGQLYFTNGIFRSGGYLSSSTGGGPTSISGSPNYNFTEGWADEERGILYIAGNNESTKKLAVYSYNGKAFALLKEVSGSALKAKDVIVYGNQLFVGYRGISEGAIMTFNLDDEGNATFIGNKGTTGYEVQDFEIFNGDLYALAMNKSNPTSGEVWVLQEGPQY